MTVGTIRQLKLNLRQLSKQSEGKITHMTTHKKVKRGEKEKGFKWEPAVNPLEHTWVGVI